jgi:hypothetical protein
VSNCAQGYQYSCTLLTTIRYLDPDPQLILEDVNEKTNPKYHALNRAVAGLVSGPPYRSQ